MRHVLFEERGDMLFMLCQNEPLSMDSEFPCIVKLIDDKSSMGKFNREHVKGWPMGYELYCDKIVNQHVGDYHYTRYVVVGKLCETGSKEWALWQMLRGNKVCRNGVVLWIEGTSVMSSATPMPPKVAHKYVGDVDEWGGEDGYSPFTIYVEPEPKRNPTIEVGEWYLYDGDYVQCIKNDDTHNRFRLAGKPKYVHFEIPEYRCGTLKRVSIAPDFSDADICDRCYTPPFGYVHIIEINGGRVCIEPSSREGNVYSFNVDGKNNATDKNPTLFHTAAQCAAYYAEESLAQGSQMCEERKIHE